MSAEISENIISLLLYLSMIVCFVATIWLYLVYKFKDKIAKSKKSKEDDENAVNIEKAPTSQEKNSNKKKFSFKARK